MEAKSTQPNPTAPLSDTESASAKLVTEEAADDVEPTSASPEDEEAASDDLVFLSPTGPSREQLEAHLMGDEAKPDKQIEVLLAEHRKRARSRPILQFNIHDLLIMVTFFAVGMAGNRWVPGGYFSLLVGFIALGVLVRHALEATESPLARYISVAIVAVYLGASVAEVALSLL